MRRAWPWVCDHALVVVWTPVIAVAVVVDVTGGRYGFAVAYVVIWTTLCLLEYGTTRLGTRLGPDRRRELEAALRAAPRGILIDRETDTVMQVHLRDWVVTRWWQVYVLPDAGRAIAEASDDVRAGRTGTVAAHSYEWSRGNLAVHHTVVPQRAGPDGEPEFYRPEGRTHRLRSLVTKIRTGVTRTTDAEAAELVAALRRAEPWPRGDEDDREEVPT